MSAEIILDRSDSKITASKKIECNSEITAASSSQIIRKSAF